MNKIPQQFFFENVSETVTSFNKTQHKFKKTVTVTRTQLPSTQSRALNPGIRARRLVTESYLILSPAPFTTSTPSTPPSAFSAVGVSLCWSRTTCDNSCRRLSRRTCRPPPKQQRGNDNTTHTHTHNTHACARARTHTACTTCMHTHTPQSQRISLVFHFGACSMLMQSRSSYLPLCPADGRVHSTRRS